MMNNNASLERQLKTLRKRSTFTLFLTWLALFFTVVGISAGYKNFLRVHDKAKDAQQSAMSTAQLVPSLASKESVEIWQQGVITKLKENSEQLAAELDELKAVKESNTYIAEALNKQVEQVTLQQSKQQTTVVPSQQWKVTEARNLLQVASRKLALDKDVEAAKQALTLADQSISEAALPSLLPVRAQIAKDIVLLSRHKPVMLDDVVTAIGRLSKQLKPEVTTVTTDRSVISKLETDGSDTVINRMKESINKAVVIRAYDDNLAKKINGDTVAVRYALLELKLESLKLLALKQQQAAYDVQLGQIIEQLESEHSEPLALPIRQSLDVLKSFKLNTKLPSISSPELLSSTLVEEYGVAK